MFYANLRRFFWGFSALLFVFASSAASGETIVDGPYVIQGPDGEWLARSVRGDDTAPQVNEAPAAIGRTVTVPAVGSVPEFKVQLRKPDPPAPDEVALSPQDSLFVVADTHGQFEILVDLLRRHQVIDKTLNWSYGSGHLVVLGDVFDRGPNHTEILWLIYKLETEAQKAGGGVHFVLGNHETMVMLGDRRYLHPKYPKVAQALRSPTYAHLWGEGSLLGRWLRTKATVVKLGEYLCLHGGISREVVSRKLDLATMNQSIRDMLNYTEPYAGAGAAPGLGDLSLLGKLPAASSSARELAGFLGRGMLGPLWYRGYFASNAHRGGFPVATDEDVDQTLALYGVKAILVGHTIVPAITPLYGGRVIAVQVSMRREPTGQPIAEGLRIANGQLHRASITGELEPLPSPPALGP